VGADSGLLAGIPQNQVPITSELSLAGVDVVIDFTAPAVTSRICEEAARSGAAIVCGTTGLDDAGKQALAAAEKKVPVLWEPNMSVGIFILSELVRRAVAAMPDFDVEIVEAHHKMKVDAPSGTALRLAEAARDARASLELVHGREGKPGARKVGELGMHAMRGGDVIGDHTVHLLGGGERLELSHRATSRDVFAHGALRAARWIAGKPAGRYALADVLRTSR
jgi:4-hydroxy-tetrahydrodipicolinate reductase